MKRLLPLLAMGGLIAVYAMFRWPTITFFGVYTALWLFGPGYAVERALRPIHTPPLLVRLALWLALSLALIPVCYLWTTTIGIALTVGLIRGASVALATAIVWQAWRDLGSTPSHNNVWEPSTALAFVGVLALTGFMRWQYIKGLAFPPWVDSVHHALIIRVVAETGKAPFSLRPYLPIDQFGYHWGYHAIAATVWRLTALPLPTFMLWFGQVLGTLPIIALGGCALALWRRPVGAVVAALVVGLVSIMPAFYLSWGRYTLLCGLLVLPGLMIASWHAVRAPRWQALLVLLLLLAGLNLIHFVVFCFALLWCAAAWLAHLGRPTWRQSVIGLIMVVVGTFVLTAPWFALLIDRAVPGETSGSPLRVVGGSYNAVDEGLLWVVGNEALFACAVLGAYVGLRRRSFATSAVMMWALLVAVCANPVWFGLPYLSFFTNRIAAICAFVPLSLLIGSGGGELDALVQRWLVSKPWPYVRLPLQAMPLQNGVGMLRWSPRQVWAALRTVTLLGFAGWSAQHLLPASLVVNQGTVFAHPADLDAINFVARYFPPDARFVINTEGWLHVARGSDGGWWLLPLAGRQTSTPPVIYTYGDDAYVAQATALTNWLRDPNNQQVPPEQLADWMRREGFGYAYATNDDQRLLSISRLRGAPHLFEEVYLNGEVSIFKLLP